MHVPARAMHERVKFWIQTSKIIPDHWLSANFCPIKKITPPYWVQVLQVHADLLYTRIVSSIHLCTHTLYTAQQEIVVGAPKYFSLGDKLLHIQHITYNNILCLRGLYASLFCTAFLSLKGQFHKIFYPYCFAYNILYGSNMDMLIQLC